MRVVTFFFFGLLISAFLNADDSPFLAEIPLSVADQSIPLSESKSLKFSYHSSHGEALLKLLATHDKSLTVKIINGGVELSLNRSALLPGLPLEKHSKSSFVIDLEEDSTQTFLSGFDNKNGSNVPLIDLIEKYVNGYISSPTYIHSFLIASKVASDRSGDCTEYAVLTTSLARGLDLPARYVNGVVILQEGNQTKAFGHAWSEVWYESSWHIVDAALHELEDNSLYYIPIAELENEGPGYIVSLLSAIKYFPKKITDLKVIGLSSKRQVEVR